MKKNSKLFVLFFAFGVFIALIGLSGNNLFLQSQKEKIAKIINPDKVIAFFQQLNSDSKAKTVKVEPISCSESPIRTTLQKAQNPSLVKVFELDTLCNSKGATSVMIFLTMPNNTGEAQRMANSLATTLREFATYEITPIIIVEPVTNWGLVDFDEFGSGFYNVWIEDFFIQLKKEGITKEQIGTWVPFPEANLPYWNNTSSKPNQFGKNVTIYVNILRKYFPSADASILLNATSYPSNDYNWENGIFTSLIPYIESIPTGLINSFGIQGFPWRSPASSSSQLTIYNPVEFIAPNLAMEAAQYLKVKKIWINTGTFKTKYANNTSMQVTETSKTRQDILSAILVQISYIQSKDYSVTLNLFAEDKSDTPEATDWSYGNGTPNDDTAILVNFIHDLYEKNVSFGYFNTAKVTKKSVD